MTSLKYTQKKDTQFDENGNPILNLKFDAIGRPMTDVKDYVW